MGFRFRWSKSILPGIRLNLSKSGASVSLGRRGFWYTIGSKGTRTTIGIPGTGLSWTHHEPYKNTELKPVSNSRRTYEISADAEQAIESSSIEEILAQSTSDLAFLLNEANSRWRFAPLVLLLAVLTLGIGAYFENREWLILGVAIACVAWPIVRLVDRYRRSIAVQYNLGDEEKAIFSALLLSFENIRRSKRVWHIPSQQFTSDWKRNAGASTLVSRKRIYPNLRNPVGMRSNIKFPSIDVGFQTIQFGPDCVLVSSNKNVAVLSTSDIGVESTPTSFIEHQSVPSDANIIGRAWQFRNKDGGPDRRFANNRELPRCGYIQMDFSSSGGLNEQILISNPSSQSFAAVIQVRNAQQGVANKIDALVNAPSNNPLYVLAICMTLISFAGGFIAAGDVKLQAAVKQIVDGNWQKPSAPKKMDVQIPPTPAIYNPPAKQLPQKKQSPPPNDPWRAIR